MFDFFSLSITATNEKPTKKTKTITYRLIIAYFLNKRKETKRNVAMNEENRKNLNQIIKKSTKSSLSRLRETLQNFVFDIVVVSLTFES